MACHSQACVIARVPRTRGAAPWEGLSRRNSLLPRVQNTQRRRKRACITESKAAKELHKNDADFRLSERDYPVGEVVLGMELRAHSLKAAPVDTANAEFQRPGVCAQVDDLSEESVKKAVTKVINHFQWKGPVGVSVTRQIVRALGNKSAPKALEAMMPGSRGKVATMIHTEAAAYAEMYFGPGREADGIVVVCTIGKGLGTVTYNMGQKVRNADLTHLTWTYERELGKLQKKYGWTGVAPELPANKDRVIERVLRASDTLLLFEDIASEPASDLSEEEKEASDALFAWAALIDRYLIKIASEVKPEQIILLPTGAAAFLPEDFLLPLFQPAVVAAGLSDEVLVMGAFPERALVGGAAVGGHIELGRRQASEVFRAAITETVTGSPKPRELYEQDLDWVFNKKLDRDRDGWLNHDDLAAGSKLLNTSFSDAEITGILNEMSRGFEETASLEQFKSWFERMLKLASAKVREVHSLSEFELIVEESQRQPTSSGDFREEGPLVVLECGYTHCRPCMKFERSYEGVASKFVDSVFLKVIGDGSPGAAHLCRDVLDVQSTPEFRFYRGNKLLDVMRGADRVRLEEKVQSLLQHGEVGCSEPAVVSETS